MEPETTANVAPHVNRSEQIVQQLFQTQWVLVFCTLAALGFAVLLWSRYRSRIERGVRAGDSRRTASFLSGAGASLAAIVLLGIAEKSRNGFVIWTVVAAVVALFVLGFTADALRTGRRVTGSDGAGALAIGWIVRAGALAVPFAWPVVAAYLFVSALGNPIVALFASTATAVAADGNETSARSDGSSSPRASL